MKQLAATVNKFNAKSSGFNLRPILPTGIFKHPAPASTSPMLTPKSFLPKSDQRLTSENYTPNGIIDSIGVSPLSIFKSPTPKSYALSKDDVFEIQRLRNEGVPRSKIANQFKISNHFIGVITNKNQETFKSHNESVKKSFSKWNNNKIQAANLKAKRESKWLHL